MSMIVDKALNQKGFFSYYNVVLLKLSLNKSQQWFVYYCKGMVDWNFFNVFNYLKNKITKNLNLHYPFKC